MTSLQQTQSLIHFCQREDLTSLRQEILVDYRDRIQACKRTKLTSHERQTLINWFIESLKAIDNEADIQALCEAEIALLEEGYPKSTIGSDILAKYRHAIEQAINDGDLPLTDHNSHRYTYHKHNTGEQAEAHEHYALTYLKYDPQTYKALRNQTTSINNERQDNLQPVPLHRYLEQIQKLIQTKNKDRLEYKLAIAIAGATGRRHTEVLTKGNFTLTNHPYLLHFEGQQKKKEGEPTNFDILTILPATQVIQAIIQFRKLPAVAKLQNFSSQSNEVKGFNVQVNRMVQKLFQETEIVPVIPGKNYVSIHRLRGVYGAIAVHFFCPEFRHEHRFLQNYLGHVLDEQVAPNSPATPHYFHYYLVDTEGNRLGNKGVKLAEFPLTDQRYYTDKAIITQPEPLNQSQDPQPETEIKEVPSFDFIDSEFDDELKRSLNLALSQMLSSDSYTVLIAALMAVTGRSPGELIKSGTFEASHDPFTVTFSPTGLGAKSTLKTLIDASFVVESVQKLRQHLDVQDLRYQTPSYIDNHCQPYVTQAIRAHLPFDNLDALIDFYRQTTRDYTVTEESEPSLISDDDTNRLLKIGQQLNLTGEPSQIIHGLLRWTTKQLRSLRETPPTEQTNDHDDSMKSQPRVIFGLDPMIQETLHNQAQTIALLTQQLARQDANPTQTYPQADKDDYETQIQQLQGQITKLQKDNESFSFQVTQLNKQVNDYQQENEKLKEKVSRFEAVKKVFLGEQIELPIDSDTTNSQTPQKTKTKTTSKTTRKKTRRTRGPKGAAKDKAQKVLDAVTQWNQQHPDQTWAINTCLLETSFGIHRQAAVEFQKEHQSEIEQLHSNSNVSNPRTHNRGKDSEQLKAFVLPLIED
ncbi:unknown [Crocosphaera subtropica ATCC 51142]|uniref:Telomere resolvase ResT/TelK catalytic domain-containing protein n=1 Tax=Crocosphaera subtropica (strain ATCC 51142 / BH68) TaxID=43989 RepID=B1X346_CROS5|nr:protelomerase family protein [Crocosphaera subtropica]ACB54557.1 unknown [Crocosphaera subtropica ATCC 51142]